MSVPLDFNGARFSQIKNTQSKFVFNTSTSNGLSRIETFDNRAVRFSGNATYDQETQKKIETEAARLAEELPKPGFLGRQLLKLDSSGELRKFRTGLENTYKKRAIYNVTGNVDVLNEYLPYRQQLSGAKLAKYDQLVKKVMDKVQFSEADNNIKLFRALNYFVANGGKEDNRFFFVRWVQNLFKFISSRPKTLTMLFSPDFRRSYYKKLVP